MNGKALDEFLDTVVKLAARHPASGVFRLGVRSATLELLEKVREQATTESAGGDATSER